jgi:hypothetical protein
MGVQSTPMSTPTTDIGVVAQVTAIPPVLWSPPVRKEH